MQKSKDGPVVRLYNRDVKKSETIFGLLLDLGEVD